jgi:hypothetical protein
VGAPRQEVAEWSPTPNLLPILRQLPGRVPHIVVVTDRVGADISVATLVGKPEIEDEVDGRQLPDPQVPGGGWAHHRYQHNAENKWIHNADNVAERIASLVRRLHPRFVLLAGDMRARQILTDRASDLWSELIVSMDEGGRAGRRRPRTGRAAARRAGRRARGARGGRHRREGAGRRGARAGRDRHGLCRGGAAQGQVETLVLADQPDDEELARRPSPPLLASSRAT